MVEPSNIYFLSDLHLGATFLPDRRAHEKKVVSFLREILPTAKRLYLLGDVFDFWYEYKYVVPKGFVRFFGLLANFVDNGGEVHFCIGNHDLWVKDYFQKELGWTVHHKGFETDIKGKKFFLIHGDLLPNSPSYYKRVRGIMGNAFIQRCFEWLHPDRALSFGFWWSKKNRMKKGVKIDNYEGDHEFQVAYAQQLAKEKELDYIVMGHRHIPMEKKMNDRTTYINLGDWVGHFSYGCFNGDKMELKTIK